MKELIHINPLFILVQATATCAGAGFIEELYEFFADLNEDQPDFPSQEVLQAQVDALIAAGKPSARMDTYRFYGMYQDEPQSYDGLTTAWIPDNLASEMQENYAKAAAALTLINGNDNDIDILGNFELENIYLVREQYLVIGRKVGDPEACCRIFTVEADTETSAVKAFVEHIIALEHSVNPTRKLEDKDIIRHARRLKDVTDNLLVAPRVPV